MSIDINKDIDSCEEQAIYIPGLASCDECDAFEQRLRDMEAMIAYLRSVMQERLTAGEGIIITDQNVISAVMNSTNTFTKTEVLELIDAIETQAIKVVDELPAVGDSNTIYWVKDPETGYYDMWAYEEGMWLNVGTSRVDLSDYQKKLTAGTDLAIDDSTNTIYHRDSGVAAASKGDTSNQTPAFGGTFKALSGTVNARGHLTAFADHTVKIPNTEASTTAAGLMSASDKTKLNGIATGATKNALSISMVDFKNASAVTINAANAGTITCNSGTEPRGYTYAGVVGFNTSNVNLPAATVNKNNIRVINLSGGTYTVPANAASITRLYIKIA